MKRAKQRVPYRIMQRRLLGRLRFVIRPLVTIFNIPKETAR